MEPKRATPKPLQLGTLILYPAEGHGPSTTTPWVALDAAFLERTEWRGADKQTAELLIGFLRDAHVHLTGEWRRRGPAVDVRISIVPNDEGQWNRSTIRVNRLKRLFPLLDRGWEQEQGLLLESPPEDSRTGMQALYSLIESPPEPSFGPGEFVGDEDVYEGLTNYENPYGVNTLMYKYQIRSVARMLQMETQPGTMADPSYSRFTEAGTGERYYVDLRHMDICRNPRRFPLSCGGILCEQMGVGKTLMCLALVLVSRHQPTMPPVADNVSQTFTDVELRTYPTAEAAAMRVAVGMAAAGDGANYENGEYWDDLVADVGGTPSLASICADIVVKTQPVSKWRQDLPPTCEKLLDRQCVFYRFPPPVRLPRGAKKVPFIPAERILLAPTTLVVVPAILVPQWLAEAETHLDKDALKILSIKEGKDPLPPIGELIRYDIVLMSLDRFRREGKKDPDELFLSTELLRVRWKRIILDEGNIANNNRSDAMLLAEALSIERRWIVSGTPTIRLKQGTESAIKSFLESEGMQRVDSSSRSRTGTPSQPRDIPPSDPIQRKWTRADLDDVARVGNMLRGFLAAEVFKSEDFAQLVTKPLRKMDGPMYGAVDRIRQIMSAIMVKHRPGVIDEEVALPPSSLSAETVRFTPWQLLTYNALTALVASNVYTSNFEDADYFLHARNQEAFSQVVANLHLACLWFSSPDMDLEGALSRTVKHLETKTTLTDEQRRGLDEAVAHMRAALDTPGWAEFMRNAGASLPYDGSILPYAVKDAWSTCPDTDTGIIDAHAFTQIRALNKRGARATDIALAGWDDRAKTTQALEQLKIMERKEKEWWAKGGPRSERDTTPDRVDLTANGSTTGQPDPLVSPSKHRTDKKAAADKPKAPRPVHIQKKDAVNRRLDAAARNAEIMTEQASGAPRPLPAVIYTSSRSSKVDFVIRSVLTSAQDDKFILFGSHSEIGHMTEALDLAGISSVYAGAMVKQEQRRAALKDFAKPDIRVCLLELKFAARGLTLTHANRMIFLSPVWSLDVQAQAIKRIHRIGQTRPTHISILVTEGTFEEDIARRQAAARSSDEEKMYSRALIENPRFVYGHDEPGVHTYPVRLIPPGTESQAEAEEYARTAARITPPGRRDVDIPIPTSSVALVEDTQGATESAQPGQVHILPGLGEPSRASAQNDTPGTEPDRAMGSKRALEDAPEPQPKPRKRLRFAE